ncbi:hypothetical protein [Wolbachia endosymbiont (group A) of Scambus nigricans]
MLLACYSHKHISYRIRTIIRKAILHIFYIFKGPSNSRSTVNEYVYYQFR